MGITWVYRDCIEITDFSFEMEFFLGSFCLAMVVILHFAGPAPDCARLFG